MPNRALDVTAIAGKQTARMGDTLKSPRGVQLRFEGAISGVGGGEIEVILDGRPMPLLAVTHIGSVTQPFAFSWRTDGERHWIRLNVRDSAGHLALLGNPIYVRSK
jgi:hypothetical protein